MQVSGMAALVSQVEELVETAEMSCTLMQVQPSPLCSFPNYMLPRSTRLQTTEGCAWGMHARARRAT